MDVHRHRRVLCSRRVVASDRRAGCGENGEHEGRARREQEARVVCRERHPLSRPAQRASERAGDEEPLGTCPRMRMGNTSAFDTRAASCVDAPEAEVPEHRHRTESEPAPDEEGDEHQQHAHMNKRTGTSEPAWRINAGTDQPERAITYKSADSRRLPPSGALGRESRMSSPTHPVNRDQRRKP